MDWDSGLLISLFLAALALFAKIYAVMSVGICKSKNRLNGKVVVVTGASSGIGKEAARELLKRGARVILACRNVNKATKIANEFKTENPDACVSVKRLDLCDLSSVRLFADEILKEEKKLDILVNNAGSIGDVSRTTADGFEEMYQANFLGAVLLTDLLLPLLKSSVPSRIINTGSVCYWYGNIDPSTFETALSSDFMFAAARYGDAKLAMLMWTRALGAELEGTGVTINILHPGTVRTALASGSLTFSILLTRFTLFFFGCSAVEGAQTILHLCLDPSGGKENGQYWENCTKRYTWRGNNAKANKSILEVARRVLHDKKRW